QITGRLLSRLFDHRDDYVLATKVFFPMGPGRNDRGLSRKHILAAIDASLRRLGTDYVDLYQIHRWDYETPVEETMEALHDVVKAGKARSRTSGTTPTPTSTWWTGWCRSRPNAALPRPRSRWPGCSAGPA